SREIAVIARYSGRSYRVYRVPLDGGPIKVATDQGSEVGQGVPTWSPDGRYLLFGDYPDRHYAAQRMLIHKLDLATGEMVTVPGSEGFWNPRWSPDGRFIAALTRDSRSLVLWDENQHTWATLLQIAFVENPTWSPDSRFI